MAKAKRKKAKPKRLSYSSLVKKAEQLYQQKVKTERVDEHGYLTCVTCGDRYIYPNPEGEMHAGHFIHARNRVKFTPMNVNPQCRRCNHKLMGNGKPREYARYLVNRFGPKLFNWLLDEGTKRHDFTRGELDRIIEESREIIRLHGGKPCR